MEQKKVLETLRPNSSPQLEIKRFLDVDCSSDDQATRSAPQMKKIKGFQIKKYY